MTILELKRAKRGWDILEEIENLKYIIARFEKDKTRSLIQYLDEDICEDARGKQIERYKQKIEELQKQFDEL